MLEEDDDGILSHSDGALEHNEKALMEDDEAGLIVGRSSNYRRPEVENMTIEQILHGHARQVALISDRFAQSESELLAYYESDMCSDPEATLALTERAERLRRSAADDMRRTMKLIGELNSPPQPAVQVGIVSVSPEQIEGGSRREIGPGIRGELEGG